LMCFAIGTGKRMFHMDCFIYQFIEQLKYVLRVKT